MVAAGPNASTSCPAFAAPASSSLRSVGATNDDLFRSMPSSGGALAPPQRTVASDAKRRMPSNAAACWARVTSGPMRVSACRGSPTFVALSFAASASATASVVCAGTKMRRMAVHFCPALMVISRTISRTNASKAAPAGARSEEHTSELRHLVISYAVFCLEKKNVGWEPDGADDYMLPMRYAEMRPACYDADARVQDINLAGVYASVAFQSMVCGFCGQLVCR